MRPFAPRRVVAVLASLVLLVVPAVAQDAQEDGAAPAVEAAVESLSEEGAFQRFDSAAAAFEGFFELMRAGDAAAVADAALFRARSDDPDVRARLARQLYEVLLRTGYDGVSALAAPRAGATGRASFEVDHPKLVPRVRTIVLTRGERLGWHFDPAHVDWIAPASAQLADELPAEAVLAEMPLLERWQYRLRTELPDALRGRSFVLENWQWIGLALLLFVCVILHRLVQGLLGTAARRLGGAESLARLARELGNFVRPGGLFVAALAFGALLPLLGLEGSVRGALRFAAELVATFAGLWAVYRLVDLGCGVLQDKARTSSNRFDDILVPLVHKTLRILVAVIGIVYLAAAWTDDLWSVVAGLSIGSLAIGFAARDSIENLFGTFTVLTDKPFALGDWIAVDGLDGTVEEVGFRSTRIRTFYDSLLSVPNRKFINGVVDNYGRRKYRRIKSTLRLAVDTPPETVDAFCEAVRQVVRRHPYSADRGFHVYLNDFGEDSLDVLLYTFVETPDWATELRERHRLLGDILRVARELDVRLSVPAQSILVRRPDEVETPPTPTGDSLARGRGVADDVVSAQLGPPGSAPPPPVGA